MSHLKDLHLKKSKEVSCGKSYVRISRTEIIICYPRSLQIGGGKSSRNKPAHPGIPHVPASRLPSTPKPRSPLPVSIAHTAGRNRTRPTGSQLPNYIAAAPPPTELGDSITRSQIEISLRISRPRPSRRPAAAGANPRQRWRRRSPPSATATASRWWPSPARRPCSARPSPGS